MSSTSNAEQADGFDIDDQYADIENRITFADSLNDENDSFHVAKDKDNNASNNEKEIVLSMSRSKSLDHLTNNMPYMYSFRQVTSNNDAISDAASTTKSEYNFVLDNYLEYTDDSKIPRLRGKGANNIFITAIQSSHWAALCTVATMSCFLTYSISNHEPFLRADLSQALIITIVLATFPEVAASAGAGAFAGMASLDSIPNYGWLTLLALITSSVWMIFHRFKVLVGCGGRIGTCAFISMNITVALFAMPSGTVSWSLYVDTDQLWSERLELVPSILTVVVCTFLSTVGGFVRLKSKLPLNPVQAPTTISLLCMLIVEPMGYTSYTTQIDTGLAVGSFVAMASEHYLPSVLDFSIAGFLAGLWILFLDPFFIDFGGKKGFTAFCGFVTYVVSSKVSRSTKRM